MNTARRDFLLLGAGAATGLVFSPVPWKLLDDSSIWTQNWSWIPRPPRGEIYTRHTACTLCPAGCGVRARCVGDQPVGLAGVPSHPLSSGRLCAMGYAAHQLPYHPSRLRHCPPDAAKTIAAKLAAKGRRVLLDLVPGRAASAVYARLELTYATLQAREDVAFDASKARTIVSFGAPVLERWGPVLAAWGGEAPPRFVQVEPVASRSAMLADVWLPARPGTEGVIARALSGAIPPDAAAEQTGVSREGIDAALHLVRDGAPVLAVTGGALPDADELAIAALNRGSAAVVRRNVSPIAEPKSTLFASIEDASIDLLFIDHGPVAACPPWDLVRRKLAPNAFVVGFSPFAAASVTAADLVIPTAAWLEADDDAVQAPGAPLASYTIASALMPRPAHVLDPVELLGAASGAREAEMKSRLETLYKSGKGSVFLFSDSSVKPVKDFESPGKLWDSFKEGAMWTGEPPKASGEARACLMERGDLLPNAGVLPSLACKLYQESRLFKRSA